MCKFCRSAVLCIRILEVADQDAWLKNPNKSRKNRVVSLFHFSFAKCFDDSLQVTGVTCSRHADTAAPRMHMTSSSVACPHWVRSSTAKISWESEMKMFDGKGAVQDAHSFVPFKLYIYINAVKPSAFGRVRGDFWLYCGVFRRCDLIINAIGLALLSGRQVAKRQIARKDSSLALGAII